MRAIFHRMFPYKAAGVLFLALSFLFLLSSSMVYAQVTAQMADSIVETIGLAAHMNYKSYDYFRQVYHPRLGEIGVRYIRDGGTNEMIRKCGDLSRDFGIKVTLVADSRDEITPSNVVSKYVIPHLNWWDAVEGPNEWDAGGRNIVYNRKTFPGSVKDYQDDLWRAIKNYSNASDPSLQTRVRAVKVLAPSMAHAVNSSKVGVVPSDYGTTHSYCGSMNLPDDQLDTKWIPGANILSPGKEIYATETGYCDAVGCQNCCANQGGISQKTLCKYLPRQCLEYYIHPRLKRIFLYNFQVRSDNFFVPFLNSNGEPKPAFYAIKNLIKLLRDPGPAFKPGSLKYSLSGNKDNMREVLVQKRNGVFILILWLNVKSWNYDAQSEINTSRPATLTFGQPVASVKAYHPGLIGNSTIAPFKTFTNPASVSIDVPDHLLILEIDARATVQAINQTRLTQAEFSSNHPWKSFRTRGEIIPVFDLQGRLAVPARSTKANISITDGMSGLNIYYLSNR